MRDNRDRLRLQIIVLAIIAAMIVLMLTVLFSRLPVLIYNGSGSAPLGFYTVENRLPSRGETALVMPPPAIELFIVARGLLPPAVPLVKQEAAVGGDEVCRSREPNGVVTINGEVYAEAYATDDDGRPLPAWDGCIRLIDGEFFLLQPHPRSFDSRYFGPVLRCDILGVARPLWTWDPDR